MSLALIKKLIESLPEDQKKQGLEAITKLEADSKNKVNMTQDELNALIDTKFEAGFKKAQKQSSQAGSANSEEKKELEELRQKLKDLESKGTDDKNKGLSQEEVQRLLKQKEDEYLPKIKTYEDKLATYMAEKKKAAIINEAAKLNAVDPEIVAKLCSDAVHVGDDGNLFIANEKGNPLIGTDGKELGIGKYVESFLGERTYLVKPSGTNGAGSGTSANTSSGNSVSIEQLKDLNYYRENKDKIKI